MKLARAIPVRDPANVLQLVLYLRGVGTGSLTDKVLGGATGESVENNLRSGYMFIAQNYEPGDEIFLFGFSRGAFTARSLAGFISAAGLLKREMPEQYPQCVAILPRPACEPDVRSLPRHS